MPTTISVPENTARFVADHPGTVKFGRFGWLAKGVVYTIAGVLAVAIALAASGWSTTASKAANQEASPTGAIKTIARGTGGPVLLWVLAIGMFVYAAWRVVSAFLPGGHDAEAAAKRVGYVVSAVIYATFGFTAIALARHTTTNPNGNSKVTDITGRLLRNTAGRWLIGIVGVVVIAAGVYRIVKGLKQDVNDELDLSGMSPERVRWTRRLGAIGEVGRGIGIGLIGFFLLRAALTYNAAEATGLDGALRRLALQTWGQVLVAIIGIGFVAYGVFCMTTFTHRRLQAP